MSFPCILLKKQEKGFVMGWFFKCVMSILSLILFYWGCKFFFYRKKKCSITSMLWQVDFEKVFLSPLKLLCVSLGIYYSVALFNAQFGCSSSGETLKSFRDFFLLISVSWMVYRWKQELFKKKWQSVVTMELLNKLISVAFFLLFILMALQIFQVDIVPLLAFGGIGAAALGFAAKDVLGNFFGGGMLSLTSPFVKGEMIFLPDRKLEGIVEDVGWYITSIRDKDKRPMYFPNSLFSSIPVINLSRMSHRRIYEVIHFAYQDFAKVTQITATLREFLSHHPNIDLQAPFLIYWDQIGNYSIQIIVDVYTSTTEMKDFILIKENVLDGIFSTIRHMGVEVAYPTSLFKKEEA